MKGGSLFWLAFALATILFYAVPLFSSQASIHWDLADASYPAQKYFEESIRAGRLPQWTPYLNSGMPFLADPRTGAWYPLHWPFFLIGVTPRAMFWELALHAFLALTGAFLLARRIFGAPGPAAAGAMLYAWGGFFAAHSSHLGKFEAAALLPWLLWAALGALESGGSRWIAGAGAIGGFIVLAGDIPAAVECGLTLIFVAAATRAPGRRTVTVVAVAILAALLLSAVLVLPAIRLAAQSTGDDASGAALPFRTLATLVSADYYGLMSGLYSGPGDLRQNYLYGGLLLLPLALAGFARREKTLIPLALLAPALWFAFGKRAGLYTLLALIPGLRGSAPVDIWFVAALGLSLAAASGAAWVVERFAQPRVWVVLLVLNTADLWHWNMDKNPLVYAATSYASLYGDRLGQFEKRLEEVLRQRPISRVWSPFVPLSLGIADAPLLTHTEVTYGFGLAETSRYSDYLRAAGANPKLLNGLAVTHFLSERGGNLIENPAALQRISAPPRVEFVADRKAALAALATLDPAQTAVVEAASQPLAPAVPSMHILDYRTDFYRVRYTAAADSLLRIAVPYYPGWSAAIDGQAASILPVDEALMGVIVPAGDHEMTLRFRLHWFF